MLEIIGCTYMKRSFSNSPFHAGLLAARANLVPGVLIWSIMLAVVLAYYHHDLSRSLLEEIAEWKRHYGYAFSFIATGLAGGVLPELLKVVLFQNGKPARENIRNISFGFPFWGVLGCIIDAFYRVQAIWFGADPSVSVLIQKVLVDQFIFSPLFGTAVIVWVYEWRRLRFRPEALRGIFTLNFYRSRVFPSVIAGWGVWIPAVSIIYSLPSMLQIPLFVLATSFWSLIITFIAASHQD